MHEQISLVRRALLLVEQTPLAPLSVVIRWCFVFYQQLRRDMAFVRASGMAYATLVAMVPSLVLIYGVLVATGAGGNDPEQALTTLFDQVFGEVPGVRDVLIPGLVSVDLAALGIVSTVAVIAVAARLYLMVEKAYCDVFQVPVRRKFTVRLLNFYFTVTAGPIVLALMMGGTFELATGLDISNFRRILGLILQYALLVAAIRLLPATQVRWWPALLGGAVSWSLLEAGRRGLSLYVIWFAGNDPLRVVYGSLAFIPVFLAWIYLIWVFVLLGVEVAAVSQNYTSLVAKEHELQDPERAQYPSIDTALQIATWVSWSFVNGGGAVTFEELVERCDLDGKIIHDVLGVLQSGNIVVRTEHGWLPARPARNIQLAEVVACWRTTTVHRNKRDAISDEMDRLLAIEGTMADAVDKWAPKLRLVDEKLG